MGVVTYDLLDCEILGEARDGEERTYVPDPLGSTAALLDTSQNKTDKFLYWPYGEERSRTGTTETPFRFAGTLRYYGDGAGRNYVSCGAGHLACQTAGGGRCYRFAGPCGAALVPAGCC
jgi:hypothetical protein